MKILCSSQTIGGITRITVAEATLLKVFEEKQERLNDFQFISESYIGGSFSLREYSKRAWKTEVGIFMIPAKCS